MCRCFLDFEGRERIDYEVEHVLPVIDAFGIMLPYASGTIDYKCNVQQTPCNMRYHTASARASHYWNIYRYRPIQRTDASYHIYIRHCCRSVFGLTPDIVRHVISTCVNSFSFSERELTFTFAICYLPSVCLSVCLSVTFVRPTQAVQIFGNISTALGTLANPLTSIENFTEIVRGNPLCRGS